MAMCGRGKGESVPDCYGCRRNITFLSAVCFILLPLLLFFLRESREPSYSCSFILSYLILRLCRHHVIYVFLYPRTISSCPFLSLSLGLSCINLLFTSFFFPLYPHRDFQLALACCNPPRSLRFLFLTLTIPYFSASVLSMFVFSAHTLKFSMSRISQLWTVAAPARS